MTTPPSARRRFKRYRPTDLEGRLDASIPARVVDISVSGLAVETDTQLRIGRTYRFVLGDDAETLKLVGRVQWSRLRGTRTSQDGDPAAVYNSGIALEDMLSETAQQLIRLVERTAILSPGERLFARLRPGQDTGISVESSIGLVVRQISRRGMLVECEVMPDPSSPSEIVIRLGDRDFRSRVRIAYTETRRDARPESRHHVGMELVDTSPECRAALDAFIRSQLERRGIRGRPDAAARPPAPARQRRAPASAADDDTPAALRGNVRRLVVHRPGCAHYSSAGALAEFDSLADAEAAGFRPCKLCRPR